MTTKKNNNIKDIVERQKEYQDFLELCKYIEIEILQYPKGVTLKTKPCLRLKGLAKGIFMANNKTKSRGEYSYKVILYTFKAYKQVILQGFKNKEASFNNDMHKFNYCMVIIEKNINDVCIRLEKARKSKEKAENLNLDNIKNKGAEYKTKTKKTNDKLNNLW